MLSVFLGKLFRLRRGSYPHQKAWLYKVCIKICLLSFHIDKSSSELEQSISGDDITNDEFLLQLAFEVWKRLLIAPLQRQLVSALLDEINK